MEAAEVARSCPLFSIDCRPTGCVSADRVYICKSAWEQSAFTFQSEDDSISKSIRMVAEQQEE